MCIVGIITQTILPRTSFLERAPPETWSFALCMGAIIEVTKTYRTDIYFVFKLIKSKKKVKRSLQVYRLEFD